MNERQAFIRAICEEPDEDTHRLVFADWLDENGEPNWAEYIRATGDDVWPAFAGMYSAFCNELVALSPRLQVGGFGQGLGARKQPYWRFGLPGGVGEQAFFYFDRGFVCHIELPCAEFVREGFAAALFAAHPITSVRLTDIPVVAGGASLVGWAQSSFTRHGAGEVWYHLRGWACQTMDGVRLYNNDKDAFSAMSTSCLAIGRAQAKLPPLTAAVAPTVLAPSPS